MTPEEKARLEALKAKGATITTEEKAELDALVAKEGGEQTFSAAYVKTLREEAAKYRTRATKAEEEAAKFATIDPKDLEELATLKAQQAEVEKKKLESAGEFGKLREQLVACHTADLAKETAKTSEAQARITQLEADLAKIILDYEISSAATAAGAHSPKLVQMAASESLKVETGGDGRRTIQVLDATGNIRVDLKTGTPLTVMQYLEEMKQSEEFSLLFKGGTAGSGSKTLTTFQGAKVANPWLKTSFNLTLQGQITKNDPNIAARLKAEAGV